VTIPNVPSVRLHESVGFKPVGVYRRVGYKLGAWHDVAWFQAAIQPEQVNPEQPRSMSGLHVSEYFLP
jgi:phosphinothricin acetyltransferase